MIATKEKEIGLCEVIHPLFDRAEPKLDGEGLGRMNMTRRVRLSLLLLRVYVIAMGLMLGYHMLSLAAGK